MNELIAQIANFDACNAGVPLSLLRRAAREVVRETWQDDPALLRAFRDGTLDLAAEAERVNEALAEAGTDYRINAEDVRLGLADWLDDLRILGDELAAPRPEDIRISEARTSTATVRLCWSKHGPDGERWIYDGRCELSLAAYLLTDNPSDGCRENVEEYRFDRTQARSAPDGSGVPEWAEETVGDWINARKSPGGGDTRILSIRWA